MSEYTGRKKREELIARFNERVNTSSAYLEVPNKDRVRMVDGIEDKYDVSIPEIAVGHGALVLYKLDAGSTEALPFAISPERTISPDPNDFIYGFHKYVSREVAEEMEAITYHFESPLDMWKLANEQVIAVLRAAGQELTANKIEAVRRLSPSTPEVIYATTRFEDDARIKIAHGKVLVRHFGAGNSWFEQEI